MARYELIIVNNKSTIKEFLDLPARLNKDDNNYIRPLNDDIEKIFHPDSNKKFQKGDAIRWILANDKGMIVGRIAAFYERSKPGEEKQLTGGCGFFECINDQEAADILFNAALDWLKKNRCVAMDGPVNFGSRETFWGCLKEGFYEPNYNMPYNPPFYNDLFEAFGFKNYFEQYTYHMPIDPGIMDPSIKENADRCKQDSKFSFTNVNKKLLDRFADDFTVIFNEAWANFPGVKPMKFRQAKAMFEKMKPVTDERTIIFGYYENRPVGFFIMIPDLFQSYKRFNGRFGPFNKIRLMYDLKCSKKFTKLIGLIFGVVPEFQKRGVSGGMIMHFADNVGSPGFRFTDLEMNWIGDFNPAMIKMVGLLGAKVRKTHITYRFLFDRDAKFERAKKVS